MKAILQRLTSGEQLSQEEARQVLVEIASQQHNAAQISAFLTVYLMRAISVEELLGFRQALLDLAVTPDFSEFDTIDLCGTGGDGKDTFNISTLSAFVVAGAGYKVSKHGNYAVSSSCGSSNVLEALGYQFTNKEDTLKNQLEQANICFLHAPLFHPSMKTVAPIRKELGMKTFFNILGPIVNPSKPRKQLVGVYNMEVAKLYEAVLGNFLENYAIVNSEDGYDEVSLTSAFTLIGSQGTEELTPDDLKLPRLKPADIYGAATVAESAAIFKNIISGEGSEAQNAVVIANASCAIQVADNQLTREQAVAKAQDALLGLKAYECLKKITK